MSARMQQSDDPDVQSCEYDGNACVRAAKARAGLDDYGLPDDDAEGVDRDFALELYERACDMTNDRWASRQGCIYAAILEGIRDESGDEDLLREGCEEEDIDGACYQLGRLRTGTPEDDAGLLDRGCLSGYALACAELAELAESVDGVQDHEIQRHYRRACEAGHQPSCARAGQ